MGDWTVFRRDGSGESHDGLSLDRAFGRMCEMAGFTWSIISADGGGYRLILTLKGRRLRPPQGGPMTLTEFSAQVFSHHDDRRLAEREIKLETLMRGCDGIEARFAQEGDDPVPVLAGHTDPARSHEAASA
jgi:hypothetical protein